MLRVVALIFMWWFVTWSGTMYGPFRDSQDCWNWARYMRLYSGSCQYQWSD